MRSEQNHRGSSCRPHCCPCTEHAEDGVNRRRVLRRRRRGGRAGRHRPVGTLVVRVGGRTGRRRGKLPSGVLSTSSRCWSTTSRRGNCRRVGVLGAAFTRRKKPTRRIARIKGELDKLQAAADFPVNFLPISAASNAQEIEAAKGPDRVSRHAPALCGRRSPGTGGGRRPGGKEHDHLLPAQVGARLFVVRNRQPDPAAPVPRCHFHQGRRRPGRRHRSPRGDPLAIARALRPVQHDGYADSGASAAPRGWGDWVKKDIKTAPESAKDQFKLEIRTITYDELAQTDQGGQGRSGRPVDQARRRADEYLKLPGDHAGNRAGSSSTTPSCSNRSSAT